jgi:ornithine decarboxylase
VPNVDRLVAQLRPVEPVYCLRSAILEATARRFIAGFPGDVLYAVKCNAEPSVLRALWRGGVRHFDCASPGEIRLVRQLLSAAEIHYMHPIKLPSFIRQAYFDYGVRDFSLDSIEELDKIVAATDGAADLGLHIRLATVKGETVYDLSGKFGAPVEAAVELLRRARAVAARLGICFHVGSQCLDPAAYARALERAGAIVEASGVALDIVDVGGGFPVSYPDQTPPPLGDYFDAIAQGVAQAGLAGARLWCEPGRALVAAGASVVVQVIARRGATLHLNDGIYGNLMDAGVTKWRFPARAIRFDGAPLAGETMAFSFYGPSCDSADFMPGPFLLPADIGPGDWIELGQLGAYGNCFRTGFNGFERTLIADVSDPPLLATPGHLDQPALNAA